MTPTMLSAILSLDAYNRGGNETGWRLKLPSTDQKIGSARVYDSSQAQLDTDLSFVAVAYTLANGATMISPDYAP